MSISLFLLIALLIRAISNQNAAVTQHEEDIPETTVRSRYKGSNLADMYTDCPQPNAVILNEVHFASNNVHAVGSAIELKILAKRSSSVQYDSGLHLTGYSVVVLRERLNSRLTIE